jgi:carbon-monoxide dehydrogenase medium subunit
MKAAAFDYVAPRSIEEALEALVRYGDDAKLLAGGQSLAPVLALRLASPAVLVDLNRVEGLDRLEVAADGALLAGAMVRSRTLERSPEVARTQPLVHDAMPWVAHVQIRNRGTLGGSLAHADPSAELPAVALACGATLLLRGPAGVREVEAAAFFRGLFTTALAEDEILVGVRFPARPPGRRHGFAEIARRHGDYAMLGVALNVDLDASRRIADARVVLFGAADLPVRARAVEDALIGEQATEALAQRVAPLAVDQLEVRSDSQASAEYRLELAQVLVRRTLARALAGADAADGASR